MRIYETGLLLAPDLSEEENEKIILQVTEVISQKKGSLVKQERWGKRKIAYPIKKFNEAYYIFFHYEGHPDIPLELERRFKQTDSVLRYLTLKKDIKDMARRKRKKETEEGEKLEASPKELTSEEMSHDEEIAPREPDEEEK